MTFYWLSPVLLLHKPLLFQEIGGHFFGIQSLYGTARIELLQRFCIQFFKDRFEPVGDIRVGFQHRLTHHRRGGINRLNAFWIG